MKAKQDNKVFGIHYKGELVLGRKRLYKSIGVARNNLRYMVDNTLDDYEIVEYGPIQVVEKYSKIKRDIAQLETKIKRGKRNFNRYKRYANDSNISKNYVTGYWSGMAQEAEKFLIQSEALLQNLLAQQAKPVKVVL